VERRMGEAALGREAGLKTRINCHSFRATSITNYLEHKGTLGKYLFTSWTLHLARADPASG